MTENELMLILVGVVAIIYAIYRICEVKQDMIDLETRLKIEREERQADILEQINEDRRKSEGWWRGDRQ